MPKKKKSNIFNYDEEEKTKNSKKVIKKKTNSKTKKVGNNDKFNFDDEIVIGVSHNIKHPENRITKKIKKKPVQNNKNKKKTKVKSKSKGKSKSNRKFNIKRVLIFLLIILLLIGILSFLGLSPMFNIKEINVYGNEKVLSEDIIEKSNIKMDNNIFLINKYLARKDIKANPYIQDVKITRSVPNIITIEIKERKPKFIISNSETYYTVSSQGYILEEFDVKQELIEIIGITTNEIAPGQRLNDVDLNKLESVLRLLEVIELHGIIENISVVNMENHLEYKLIVEDGKKNVYLGDLSNLNTRMLYLKFILEENKGLKGEVFVNVDLINKYPFFREEV